MNKTITIALCSVLLAGCGHQQVKSISQVTVPLTNLPPELAEYAKTPEGQRILEEVTKMKEEVDRTKYVLLHETDHQAVLIASREVIRTRRDFKSDPEWFGQNDSAVSKIAPNDPKLPVPLLKLDASSIFGRDDSLEIVFGGALHHQGFIAYSESFTNFPYAEKGFQKIIDGLWFYEDTK
jgi:hypothetical protein